MENDIDRDVTQIHAAQRDPRAFGSLYEAYVDMVWRHAMSRRGDIERAGDVTSLTFSKALKGKPQPELEDSSFPA